MSQFTQENKMLVEQVQKLQFYGRLSRSDAWALTPVEREMTSEFLNAKFEEAGKLMSKGISVFL